MKTPDYFISCDWGTSNFRLRLVHTDSLKVLVEHKTDQGIKVLHQKFLNQEQLGQTEFFKKYLLSQIENLDGSQKANLVVTAGMASSNIGMMELDYGKLPFNAHGEGLNWKAIPFQKGLDILLISGVKDEFGMMRGEEMQAFGLTKYLEPYQSGVLILPGTHSKHLTYQKESFTSLKSFMTGELFELLSNESILSNNVESCQWISKRKRAFEQGLAIGFNNQLSANLFSIRARNLLQNSSKKDNYFMLSGMLIGDELLYLKNYKTTVFLAAPEPFQNMYKLALETVLDKHQIICFGDSVLENALLLAQKKIIELHAQ